METDNTNQPVPPVQNIEPSQSAPLPNPSSPSKIFIIALGIVFVLMLGIGSYVLGTRKNQTVVQNNQISISPTLSQPSPTATPDETANWKTYTNTKYGFEIKYPLDWQVEVANNDSFIKLSNIKIAKQYSDAAKKIATEGTAFNNGLFINIYESDKTLEDFIQSIYNNPDSPHGNTIKSTKNIEFPNGMQAIFVESNTGGYGLDSATLLKSKDYVFRFTKYYGGAFGLEKYTDQQFNQILSTFQFSN